MSAVIQCRWDGSRDTKLSMRERTVLWGHVKLVFDYPLVSGTALGGRCRRECIPRVEQWPG